MTTITTRQHAALVAKVAAVRAALGPDGEGEGTDAHLAADQDLWDCCEDFGLDTFGDDFQERIYKADQFEILNHPLKWAVAG